jgi:hypothetical protein
MSLGTLLLVGFITAAEFFYILRSMNENLFLTALGYKAYVDAIFGLSTTAYFALSGTISGIVIAAFAGIMFSLCLYLTEKFFGSRKRINGSWVISPPKWTIQSIIAGIKAKCASSARTSNCNFAS